MVLDDSRWTEVTPSQFPHEAEGLRLVRELLPNVTPYRAWSNFEFRDSHGRWHEVDLLVLGRGRLHLVELKFYSGTLSGDDHRWLRNHGRAEDSPLKLARRKAQRLATLLRDELGRFKRERPGLSIPDSRRVVPFVQESVFLHHPGLRCVLPAASRKDLFGLDEADGDSGLPGISERVTAVLRSPVFARQRTLAVRGPADEQIAALLTALLTTPGRRLPDRAVAELLSVPPARLRGTLAQVRRLLDVESYPVTSRGTDGMLELDETLLREQFGV